MQLLNKKDYSSVKVDMVPSGYEMTGKGVAIPGTTTPYRDQQHLAMIGWPYGGLFPGLEAPIAYEFTSSMFSADLDAGDCAIVLPGGYPFKVTKDAIELNAQMGILGITYEWDIIHPRCTITTSGGTTGETTFEALVDGASSEKYKQNYWGNSTIDLTDLSNHYVVENFAVERGRGNMFWGWFYVDTSGPWNFALDGTDIIELLIDGVLVVGRYTSGSASGDQSKNSNFSLAAGWHKMWVYSSHSSLPTVWYKRPGDANYSLIDVGIQWSPHQEYNPSAINFSKTGTSVTTTFYHDSTNSLDHVFDVSELIDSDLTLSMTSNPRAVLYWDQGWRDSLLDPTVMKAPPRFDGIRTVMPFNYESSMLTYKGLPPHSVVPKFAFSTDKTNWYIYTAGSTQSVNLSSASDLSLMGNTAFEINQIPQSVWTTFASGSPVYLCLTGQAPVVCVDLVKAIGLNNNEYAFVATQLTANDIRYDKREL